MEAWAEDEILLSITLNDVKKMAKLPGSKDAWYITEATARDNAEDDETLIRVRFARGRVHSVK